MLTDNDFFTSSGVILWRKTYGENSLWTTLFLREVGIIKATARLSGGDSEPLLWGVFDLRRKSKSRNFFIENFDVKDDMLALRDSGEQLRTAVNWVRVVLKYLDTEQPDDDLLANLYWSMILLKNIRHDVADWIFFWRWIEIWGLAPDIVNFHRSMKFNDDEILLLTKIAALTPQGIMKFLSQPTNLTVRENMFKVASRLAQNFLNQK